MNKQFLAKLNRWIAEDNLIRFYHSTQWRKVRAMRMKIDNNECQVCKAEGKHTPAEMVHHVVHVRDNPMLALSLENLLSLCNICHNKEHPEKLLLNKKRFTNEERW